MASLYEKNLLALEKVNTELALKLKSIDTNTRFDVFQGGRAEAINILDTKTDEFLYTNPIDDTIKQQIIFSKYSEYEFLFIYGIGNGVLINELLKNQKLSKLILIEPEPELLYITFNLLDFSEAIEHTRVIFLDSSMITFTFLISFLNSGKLKYHAKLYDLLLSTSYYEKVFLSDIHKVSKNFTKAYEHLIYTDGNDITDQFIGLKHTILNLPIMLSNPSLDDLRKKKNSDVAVVVSTGPSLQKQLKTLKKYKDFITIISVDASLPILEKNGIKPDIVTSIERVELTSEFFKKTSDKFQKGIIFACASLEHPVTLEAIKGTKILIQRPFAYNSYLGFDEFGYIGHGMSAANLAHELAITMGYKNCLLIGQDLAYSKDGDSHSKGHILGEKSDTKRHENIWIDLKAYGGETEIKSNQIWKLFKNFFEQVISMTTGSVITFNCTEGGVRIEGSIEKPFKETLDELLGEFPSKKEKITIKSPSKKIAKERLGLAKEILENLLENGEILQKKINKIFLSLEKFSKRYEHIDLRETLRITKDKVIIKKLNEIEDIRRTIELNEQFSKFFYDIAKPYLLHYELELATIRAQKVDSKNANKEKALKWIFSHRYWLFSMSGIINNIVSTIQEELEKWGK